MEKQMKLGFSSLESAGVGAVGDAGEMRGCIACTRKKQEAQYPRKDSQISAQEFLLRTPTNGIGSDVINRQKAASENLPGAGGGSKKKSPESPGLRKGISSGVPLRFVYFFSYQLAFMAVNCCHFSGRSSRAKIAVTGQTGTQAPQSMHSTGLM